MKELLIAILVTILCVAVCWWLVKTIVSLAWRFLKWVFSLILYPFRMLFGAIARIFF
jgi:uncharacterized membrane protein